MVRTAPSLFDSLIMFRLIVAGLISLVLAGCVTRQQPLYSWGSYEPMLYASYKDPAKADEMRVSLESQIGEAEKRSQKVPPGLYAELGTLYLQAGDNDRAIGLYNKERNTWPESRGMMDAMIKNLERRQVQPVQGSAK